MPARKLLWKERTFVLYYTSAPSKGRSGVKGKNLLSISDMSDEDIDSFMAGAVELKARGRTSLLEGKVLALLFEKPSLRTRVSFEVGMRQLGGEVVYLSPDEVGLGGGSRWLT